MNSADGSWVLSDEQAEELRQLQLKSIADRQVIEARAERCLVLLGVMPSDPEFWHDTAKSIAWDGVSPESAVARITEWNNWRQVPHS
jgi:hypothetical protein